MNGATPTIDICSTHYYAHLDTDGTLKMIDYRDRVEIHKVHTKNGLHSIDEEIKIASVEAGFQWFKEQGFNELDVLEMRDREFAYLDGGFALYTVEQDVLSIILGYAESKVPEIEKLFGLEDAEEILIPYNKYIAQVGKLRTIKLN